jgi:hypothetical protein
MTHYVQNRHVGGVLPYGRSTSIRRDTLLLRLSLAGTGVCDVRVRVPAPHVLAVLEQANQLLLSVLLDQLGIFCIALSFFPRLL